MPLWKYVANRVLTLFENVLIGAKLSEYHTGYRAFSRELLEALPLEPTPTTSSSTTRCSRRSSGLDYTIAEVSCPTKYFAEASSINFPRSMRYGFGCVGTAVAFRLARWRLVRSPLFVVANS